MLKLVKGSWKYNIHENNLHLQKQTTQLILENRNNEYFQQLLSHLSIQGTPTPNLQCNIPTPTTTIPLETFHRILRANTVLYEPLMRMIQTPTGIICQSQHINIPLIQQESTQPLNTIYVDPMELYRITRIFRDRERIITTLSFDSEHLTMRLEFPWTVLNIKIPQRIHNKNTIKW